MPESRTAAAIAAEIDRLTARDRELNERSGEVAGQLVTERERRAELMARVSPAATSPRSGGRSTS